MIERNVTQCDLVSLSAHIEKTLLNRIYPEKWYCTVKLLCWLSLTASIKPNIQSNIMEKNNKREKWLQLST